MAAAAAAGGEEEWKLPPHPKIPKGKKVTIIILDGWGENIPDRFNAIAVAETPAMDHLKTVMNSLRPMT
jgi:2,3-bisphosphoglycerate-independent phosphoglycerate mutase